MNDGRRIAILIGNTAYKNPDLGQLRTPGNNVETLAAILAECGKFKIPPPLVNEGAQVVRDALDRELGEKGSQDLVLFYFAGHGISGEHNFYLAMPDSSRDSITSNGLSITSVQEIIIAKEPKRAVLILDCCESGAASEFSIPNRGLSILAAAGAIEQAKERPQDEYSLLTKHLIFGIADGEADLDRDGVVSLIDLHQYVAKQIKKEGEKQNPFRTEFSERDGGCIISFANRRSEKIKSVLRHYVEKHQKSLPRDLVDELPGIIQGRRPLYPKVFDFCRGFMTSGELIDEWLVTEKSEKFSSIIARFNGATLEVLPVEGGSFMMGASAGQGLDREQPQHTVNVPNFYIGKFPVTRSQWAALMEDTPSDKTDLDLPVNDVSWHDAIEFCEKLSARTGRLYRLPTEAEWEYACRSNVTSESTSDLPDRAWYQDNSGGHIHPVAQKLPNGWGLYDMIGNVFEWCDDDGHDNYDGAPSNGSAWKPKQGVRPSTRMARGGSYNAEADDCRCTYRFHFSATLRSSTIGFRVALDAK